jgi:HEAT repeat protein
LERHIKKTNDKFAQSPDRFAAMEKLRDIGTEEAIHGLVRRFGFVYDKTIEDEQEKEWVADALAALGDRALPPVKRFILEGETISYPLRVLERVAAPEKVLEIVDALAAREEPGYTRHPQKKLQLIGWLGEWKGAEPVELARRVVPYVADFDETVRFTAVEALAHLAAAGAIDAVARGPLLDALVRPEEESRRIQVRIAEVLADAGFRVDDTPEHKAGVVKLLGGTLPEFGLSHEKLFRKGK